MNAFDTPQGELPPAAPDGPTDRPDKMFQYRILRYSPDIVRDEWVNIGVVLTDPGSGRTAARVIESDPEFARISRLHGAADRDLLHSLAGEFRERLREPGADPAAYLERLDQSLSNAVQMSPRRGLLASDFDAEFNRLYQVYVSPPSRQKAGPFQSVRDFFREKLTDVFRRHRILGKIEADVPVEGFTQPGDPMRFDFGYQNGVRGFIQGVSLKRDAGQAKALAYTASRVRARDASIELTAITEVEPQRDNRRHRFITDTLAGENIRIVPMNQVEGYAEELRRRLN